MFDDDEERTLPGVTTTGEDLSGHDDGWGYSFSTSVDLLGAITSLYGTLGFTAQVGGGGAGAGEGEGGEWVDPSPDDGVEGLHIEEDTDRDGWVLVTVEVTGYFDEGVEGYNGETLYAPGAETLVEVGTSLGHFSIWDAIS